MEKKVNRHQDLLIIAILSLLTTIAWISSSAYHRFLRKKETTVPKEILEPLQPNINTAIINELKKKEFLNQEEINQAIKESSPSPLPLTPQQNATPSLSPAIEKEASPSSISAYQNVSQE